MGCADWRIFSFKQHSGCQDELQFRLTTAQYSLMKVEDKGEIYKKLYN